ncbi:MAG: lasso peptide biosynthesis B2 protein [Waterburya sp.]
MVQLAADNKLPPLNKNKNTYLLNHDVFLFLQDDIAQLLDFRHGQFYGLDSIGTLMVSLVIDKGTEETVKYIAQSCGVTEEQVGSDLNQLLQNLERKKLIVTQGKASNPFLQWFQAQKNQAAKPINAILLWFLKRISLIIHRLLDKEQTPSRQTVELLLTLSWISFRLLGWSRTIALWQNWHQQVEERDTSDQQEVIEEVDRTIREAAAWKLFLPMVCKERALVGYHILRTFYSLPASLVVGVDHYPFQIHAWVECDNKIVTDDPEHCEPFIPVISYS